MDKIDELVKNLIEAVSEINKQLGFASAYYYRNKNVEKCKDELIAEFTRLQDKLVNAENYGSCMKNERDNYRSWYHEVKDQLENKKPVAVLTSCKYPVEIRIIYPCGSQDSD